MHITNQKMSIILNLYQIFMKGGTKCTLRKKLV